MMIVIMMTYVHTRTCIYTYMYLSAHSHVGKHRFKPQCHMGVLLQIIYPQIYQMWIHVVTRTMKSKGVKFELGVGVGRQTYRQIDRQTDRQLDRQTKRQTARQTDRQTD